MKLYHLTSIYHLPVIMSSGYLKVVESNVSLIPHEEHKGPDVVWLTTSPRPGQGWAEMREHLAFVDKTRVIFEVDIADDIVHPWYDWARAHGSDEHSMRALAASGDERVPKRRGNLYEPSGDAALERARAEWYVVERAVPWLEWERVTDRLAGTTIWRQTLEQQTSGKLAVSKLWLAQGAEPGGQVMLKVEPDGVSRPNQPWVPTTIVSEENPGAMVQIGGEGPPDVVIDGREATADDVSKMSPQERRAYFNRVAPSVNVMRDLLGMDG